MKTQAQTFNVFPASFTFSAVFLRSLYVYSPVFRNRTHLPTHLGIHTCARSYEAVISLFSVNLVRLFCNATHVFDL